MPRRDRMFRVLVPCLLAVAVASAAQPDEYDSEIEPLLDIYCYSCHADGLSKGGFSMDGFTDLSAHLDDVEHWLPVWRNVRSQIMPPSDEDQLETVEKRKLLTWIERRVFKLDPANPDPGRVTVRRLNRTEYRHAVRDLLGVDFRTDEHFPPDDSGYGFDNIGDVLSMSPLLLEKYLTAAEEVVVRALPEGIGARDPQQVIGAGDFTEADDPNETGRWMFFNDDEEVVAERSIRWDGDYEVTLEYSVRGAMRATDHEAVLRVSAGGEAVGEAALGWDQREVIRLSGKVRLEKGKRRFSIGVSPTQPPGGDQEELALVVGRMTVTGPLDGSRREYPAEFRRLFTEGEAPDGREERDAYAGRILERFAMRAFRRPVDKETLGRLVALVREVDESPVGTFEDGIREALVACLCSPRFLFRVELQPEPDNPERVVELDEYALASRLSFFLWGSVPDGELMRLAGENRLRENLRAQVDRMLADHRSRRMVRDFVGQWLQTRDAETVPLDPRRILGIRRREEAHRHFDGRLRTDMARETELLFEHILREGRPLEEMISARYSFLNGRLAKFYGIDGVKGENFVRVDLADHPERGGVLAHGSYLIVTSNPTRTSPVKRGLFVLENILGTPAPPAPPDVPPLEESGRGGGGPRTMREMMEVHRESPDCRGCHARMDPIGLGLESFDALGRFRTEDKGRPIDTAGELITGERFSNVAELKEILASSRKEDFYRCFSEKLLTFAIGRGIEYYDAPTIDGLVARLRDHDGDLRELVMGVIESAPFQKRRGTE